jgi:hypothetical protein
MCAFAKILAHNRGTRYGVRSVLLYPVGNPTCQRRPIVSSSPGEDMEIPTEEMKIYFSDFFEVSPEVLEEYGAFDVSLINDLPLFVDPFLLFNSDKKEYRDLHNEIIRYVGFLRDKAAKGELDAGSLKAWFVFREVKQNWLGYSLEGNEGHGLYLDFAKKFRASLELIFANFGQEKITHGSHLERVLLVSDRVGRDNISDFCTNLIKHYLLEYTQAFARKHLGENQRKPVSVSKARFNYDTHTWANEVFELPFIDGDYVLLTPVDLLTKDDVWINRTDMVRDYDHVASSIGNDQLRAQLNDYFTRSLEAIQQRDEERKPKKESKRRRWSRRFNAPTRMGPTQKQTDEAVMSAIREYPEYIEWYIRYKEEHGDEAEAIADERVRSSKELYVWQVRRLVSVLTGDTGFYDVPGTTKDEARQRVAFLKDVIENKGGWRLFYLKNEPIRRESDVHILFRLTWCNTVSDVNREVNNGRGPSDFEISRGRFDKSLVEFKLAKNTQLEKNLQNQTEIYQKASDAQNALKVIVYFTADELAKVNEILDRLKLRDSPDVILIDARSDNKPSASKADSQLMDDE